VFATGILSGNQGVKQLPLHLGKITFVGFPWHVIRFEPFGSIISKESFPTLNLLLFLNKPASI